MIWLPMAASFAAALTLQDCLLVALGGLLCVRGFYWSMDKAAPLTPISAALRCLVAGLVLLALAMVEALVGITSLAGWWTPSPEHSDLAAVFVFAIVVLPALGRWIYGIERGRAPGVDVLAMAAVTSLMLLRESGVETAACWGLLASGVIVGVVGWRLAHSVANSFFGQAEA